MSSSPPVSMVDVVRATLHASFELSCATPLTALGFPACGSGHRANSICMPNDGMLYAAGHEPFPCRVAFHKPLPTGAVLALSDSSAYMSTVQVCAKIVVRADAPGLDLRASSRSLAERVSSLALCRPGCLISVNG